MTKPSLLAWLALVCGALWIALTGLCTWNEWRLERNAELQFWNGGFWVMGLGAIPLFLGLERVIDPRIAGGLLTVGALADMTCSAFAAGLPNHPAGPATEIAVFVLGPLLPFLIWGVAMTRRKRP